jgi:hypothetical protein
MGLGLSSGISLSTPKESNVNSPGIHPGVERQQRKKPLPSIPSVQGQNDSQGGPMFAK